MSVFDTHGGYFAPDGLVRIDKGGSHEENPNGGVQIGVDPQGVPNLVEEDEVIYDDYVYSDNIKADTKILKKMNLPESYGGQLYSDIANKLCDEAEERPNDPVSNNGLRVMLSRLANAQEEQKQKAEERKLRKQLNNMTPEELAMIGQQLGLEAPVQQEVPEEVPQGTEVAPEDMMQGQPQMPYAKGGKVRILEDGTPGTVVDVPPSGYVNPDGSVSYPPLMYNPETGTAMYGGYGVNDNTPMRVDEEGNLVDTIDPSVAVAFPGKTQAWVDAQVGPNSIRKKVAEAGNQFVADAWDAYKENPAAIAMTGGLGMHALAADAAARGDYGEAIKLEALQNAGKIVEAGKVAGQALGATPVGALTSNLGRAVKATASNAGSFIKKVAKGLWREGVHDSSIAEARKLLNKEAREAASKAVEAAAKKVDDALNYLDELRNAGKTGAELEGAENALVKANNEYLKVYGRNIKAKIGKSPYIDYKRWKENVDTAAKALEDAQADLKANPKGKGIKARQKAVTDAQAALDDAQKISPYVRWGKIALHGGAGTTLGAAALIGINEHKNNKAVSKFLKESEKANGGPITRSNKFSLGGLPEVPPFIAADTEGYTPPVFGTNYGDYFLSGLVSADGSNSTDDVQSVPSGFTRVDTPITNPNAGNDTRVFDNAGNPIYPLYGGYELPEGAAYDSRYAGAYWPQSGVPRVNIQTISGSNSRVQLPYTQPNWNAFMSGAFGRQGTPLTPWAITGGDRPKQFVSGYQGLYWPTAGMTGPTITGITTQSASNTPGSDLSDSARDHRLRANGNGNTGNGSTGSGNTGKPGSGKNLGEVQPTPVDFDTLNRVLGINQPRKAPDLSKIDTTVPEEQIDEEQHPVPVTKTTAGNLYTGSRYAGAVLSAALALDALSKKPDHYDFTPIVANTVEGDMPIQLQRYNPLDANIATNAVRAQGNAASRAIRNSGLGPSTGANLIANNAAVNNAIGNTLLQTYQSNNQQRNNVIAANNAALAQQAQFRAGINAQNAQMRNMANTYNNQMALRVAAMNNAAESERYAAIGQNLSNMAEALSGIGQENFVMNQINNNPALLQALYPNAGTRVKAKKGGKIVKKKK